MYVVLRQGFDSTSTDTGTGQEGDKEDADETKEKNEHASEDRYTYSAGEVFLSHCTF